MRIITSRKWVLVAVLAFGVTAVTTVVAMLALAPYQYERGTTSICGVGGVLAVSCFDGASATIAFNGLATFVTTANSDNPISTTLQATNFEGEGYDPQVGNITFSLASKDAVSTISANGTDAFPATSRLSFHGQVTLSSQPGVVYRGVLTVVNNKLEEWPHSNTRYVQEGTVVFMDHADTHKYIQVSGVEVIVNAAE